MYYVILVENFSCQVWSNICKRIVKTIYHFMYVELAWRSGCVMDCHTTTSGSIIGGDGVKTELHVLRKGQ